MYALEIKSSADKTFHKLARKDPQQFLLVAKKIAQIRQRPRGYKWLRSPLHSFNRVHIGDFVLIFKADHAAKVVTIYHYAHHDTVYRWRP